MGYVGGVAELEKGLRARSLRQRRATDESPFVAVRETANGAPTILVARTAVRHTSVDSAI
jgi:hypothetical protein